MRSILAVAGAIVLSIGFPLFSFASEENPTVEDFLHTCAMASPNTQSSDAYVECENAVTFNFAGVPCAPRKSASSEGTRLAVVRWLKHRPQMLSMDQGLGVKAALKALYCH